MGAWLVWVYLAQLTSYFHHTRKILPLFFVPAVTGIVSLVNGCCIRCFFKCNLSNIILCNKVNLVNFTSYKTIGICCKQHAYRLILYHLQNNQPVLQFWKIHLLLLYQLDQHFVLLQYQNYIILNLIQILW